MQKTVNLILGAFLVCSMLIPIISLSSAFSFNFDINEDVVYDTDYIAEYEKEILSTTAQNLVYATDDILKSEGITVDNIEVGIKKSENNSIYINRIYIYITETDSSKISDIENIVYRNMSKKPVVIVNE